MQWPDEQRFVQAVERLEDFMYQFGSTSGSPFYHRVVRCIHTSVLEPSVRFGCHHFVDTEQHMVWALGYAVHYIGKWNVMPTKKFFDYVMYRIQNPFPQWQQTRPRPRPVPAAPRTSKRACHSRGDEPSPTGLGHCARDYAVGSVHRGQDRRQWIVTVDKNGRKYWKRHTGKSAGGSARAPTYTVPADPAPAAATPPSPVIHEYWYAFEVIPLAMKFHEPSRTLTVKARLSKAWRSLVGQWWWDRVGRGGARGGLRGSTPGWAAPPSFEARASPSSPIHAHRPTKGTKKGGGDQPHARFQTCVRACQTKGGDRVHSLYRGQHMHTGRRRWIQIKKNEKEQACKTKTK
jgi:hypothetical protein